MNSSGGFGFEGSRTEGRLGLKEIGFRAWGAT